MHISPSTLTQKKKNKREKEEKKVQPCGKAWETEVIEACEGTCVGEPSARIHNYYNAALAPAAPGLLTQEISTKHAQNSTSLLNLLTRHITSQASLKSRPHIWTLFFSPTLLKLKMKGSIPRYIGNVFKYFHSNE